MMAAKGRVGTKNHQLHIDNSNAFALQPVSFSLQSIYYFFPILFLPSSPTYCHKFSSSKFQGGSLNEHLPQHQCQVELATNQRGYSCMGCLAPPWRLHLTCVTHSDSTAWCLKSLHPASLQIFQLVTYPGGETHTLALHYASCSFASQNKVVLFYFTIFCFVLFLSLFLKKKRKREMGGGFSS